MQETQFSPAQIFATGNLDHFRLNPFRALSLPVESDTQEAGWAAERLAAMTAAGIETDSEGSFLPVFGPCSEAEIRHAGTQLEEPLERLVAELFWFDLRHDPHAPALEAYLRSTDADALQAYLEAGQAAEKATTVERVNRANLALLLGLLAINNLPNGTESPDAADPSSDGEADKQKKFKWRKAGDLSIVENPHLLLSKWQKHSDDNAAVQQWTKHFEAALLNWRDLLQSDGWPELVHEKTERLQDDLLDDGTADLIARIVPGRLTDLIAGEIKKALRDADFSTAGHLLETTRQSGFDAKTLRSGLAQTKVLFQNEIRQVEELLGGDPDNCT
ncbi:MAG: hypothetical protein IPM81_02080 [Saprospirales bacterium]|nr:hypothetical protein [Saprospirales bacterium]